MPMRTRVQRVACVSAQEVRVVGGTRQRRELSAFSSAVTSERSSYERVLEYMSFYQLRGSVTRTPAQTNTYRTGTGTGNGTGTGTGTGTGPVPVPVQYHDSKRLSKEISWSNFHIQLRSISLPIATLRIATHVATLPSNINRTAL